MTKKMLVIILWFLSSVTTIANGNEELPSLKEVATADLNYTIASFEHDKKMLESQIKYRDLQIGHYEELVEINETAYKTQQITTNIMTAFVMIIVLFGLVLSYWQFKNDISGNGKSDGDEKAAFKVSKEGIEFRSSVIGLVILFISLFFFYLYVKEIYKIDQHNVQTAPANISSNNAPNGQENPLN
ncbi:hypothetical protein AB6E95_22240 [Vibrio splendidus]